jgi:hypothetical protein
LHCLLSGMAMAQQMRAEGLTINGDEACRAHLIIEKNA